MRLTRIESRRTGFTLMELLVVMGIMAVVITLTVPSFVGLGRGAKMDSALSGLKTTLSLARQWAITHRDTVYVVFVTSTTSAGEDSGIFALRTYMVFSENDGEMIKEPASIPEGVIFDLDELNDSLPSDITKPSYVDGNNVLAFKQDGSVKGAETKHIYFIEGTSDESGKVTKTFERKDASGATIYDRITVIGITGVPYVERDLDPDADS